MDYNFNTSKILFLVILNFKSHNVYFILCYFKLFFASDVLILCFELGFICDCRGIMFWVESYALKKKNVVMLLRLDSYVIVGESCFGLKVMYF
jgi:hypothetical protein